MVRKTLLYEIPKTLESAEVLDDSMLGRYNDAVRTDYNSEKARNVLMKFGKTDGELTCSSPFMLAFLQNSGLLKERIAARQDLEKALKYGLDLSGNYADFGLALETAGDSYSPNDMLAKNLAEQLKRRDIKLSKGKLIQIGALARPIEDISSEYGLLFNLNELSKKELLDSGLIKDLSEFKWDYKKEQCLARAFLNRNSDWNAIDGDLGASNGYGRVIVVSGEASAKNLLDAKIKELENKKNEEIKAINKRYAQAEKILLDR